MEKMHETCTFLCLNSMFKIYMKAQNVRFLYFSI